MKRKRISAEAAAELIINGEPLENLDVVSEIHLCNRTINGNIKIKNCLLYGSLDLINSKIKGCIKMEKVTLSEGAIYLTGAKIGSSIDIKDIFGNYTIIMPKVETQGDVTITNASVHSCDNIKINGGDFHLKDIIVKCEELQLMDTEITMDEDNQGGGLYLSIAQIRKDTTISLCRTKANMFWLTFKEVPSHIFVSPENAQEIHWAAPTIPLVVIK